MTLHLPEPFTVHVTQLPKPCCHSKTLVSSPIPFPSRHAFRAKLRFKLNIIRASTSSTPRSAQKEYAESLQLFEKLKDAEREQINKLEELQRKANVQFERQLVVASDWSRALLTMQGKLKGTEWDPENSHRIEYSEFLRFLNSNNVQHVEYSNYGQTMFVGVAASRVKDLFASSRSFAPSIIFIDEIDAIGGKRGGPDIGGGGAEREQGLLQILTEMDGFKESTSQVLVIGATNRLDILDPALLRKGRFDKIIRVGLPSKDGRLAILKILEDCVVNCNLHFTLRSTPEINFFVQRRKRKFYSRKLQSIQKILLEQNSRTYCKYYLTSNSILTRHFEKQADTSYFGRNEAGILTASKDLDYIGREELLEALKRQKGTFETGQEDNSEVPEELKLRLAYREAAVAVLACYFPDPHRPFTDTDINSIHSQPNMRYVEMSGRVFKRKTDYVDSIVRACAPPGSNVSDFLGMMSTVSKLLRIQKRVTKRWRVASFVIVIEEEMFGIDNLCWISAKATLEASRLAEFLILHTGLTAFGKAYYRNQSDLVPNLASKLEALRDEYIRFSVQKCSSVLKEYHSAVETITGSGKARGSPEVDEYGALIYAGRWGIHGVSLPGRVTFTPGNVGFSTFGAPRPMETQVVSDETWKLVDGIWDRRVQEIKTEASIEIEEDEEKPQLLMARYTGSSAFMHLAQLCKGVTDITRQFSNLTGTKEESAGHKLL
ncbi:hypothetical protein RJ639_038889 [Escallonia herrerae]|uniref:ATPase AAA-type core domain-containing protein n=1 Tax=Escallonia herrerae TaxID=1293975 RepID=A0AA88WLZ7_9ASTE|nr:hypothetical protein RJ639_038889 [Escallonia herrerae]